MPDRSPTSPSALGSSLAAVVALAISQPVLNVLGANPEFFIARASPRVDALAVGLLIGLAVPAVLAVATVVVARVRRRAGARVHASLFAVMAGLAVMQVADRLPPPAVALVAVGGGLGSLWAYRRSESFRWVASFGAAVPVAVVVVFLFVSPVSAIILPASAAIDVADEVRRPVPVVVVILDELPTASLLADIDTIDAVRHPHIARLATDGVWYRRATTVAARSGHAVPAILSGLYSDAGRLPYWADWPSTLMSALADTHDVHAREPVTDLCPRTVCTDPDPVGDQVNSHGWMSLWSDVSLVAAHVTLPAELTTGLPPVTDNWGNFGGDHTGDHLELAVADQHRSGLLDRAVAEFDGGRADDFIGWIQPPGERPPLYVLHTLTPHKPWEYLPHGQRYVDVPRIGLDDDDGALEDEWRRRFDQRRHLLQTGFADSLVGDVLVALDEFGLYEDAMIVLAADHGQAFVPGEQGREPQRRNLAEIVDVPLIVKYPSGGPTGIVDDRIAETIDVVPTVLDLLGVTGTTPTDGTSLLADPDSDRVRRLLSGPTSSAYDWDPRGLERALADRQSWFGTEPGWQSIWHAGPYRELVGEDVDEFLLDRPSRALYRFDRPDGFDRVPDEDGIVPVMITGGLAFVPATFEELPYVAVAVGGRVAAIGRAVEILDDVAPFAAMVPLEVFSASRNRVELYLIEDDADLGPSLRSLTPG